MKTSADFAKGNAAARCRRRLRRRVCRRVGRHHCSGRVRRRHDCAMRASNVIIDSQSGRKLFVTREVLAGDAHRQQRSRVTASSALRRSSCTISFLLRASTFAHKRALMRQVPYCMRGTISRNRGSVAASR